MNKEFRILDPIQIILIQLDLPLYLEILRPHQVIRCVLPCVECKKTVHLNQKTHIYGAVICSLYRAKPYIFSEKHGMYLLVTL